MGYDSQMMDDRPQGQMDDLRFTDQGHLLWAVTVVKWWMIILRITDQGHLPWAMIVVKW